MNCIWKLSAIQTNRYKLEIENESPPVNCPSLAMGPNDSTFLRRFGLGFCFYCGSAPTYPLFWKGLLDLYFSNNQMVEIKLYTNDLRTRIVTKNSRLPNRNMEKNTNSPFSVNGRICNQSHGTQMPGNIKVKYNKASGKYRVFVDGLKRRN